MRWSIHVQWHSLWRVIMGIIKNYAVLLCFSMLWATAMPVRAMSINFDDLDTSGGLYDLGGSIYQEYAWANFRAYSAIDGLDGFNKWHRLAQ